MIDFVVLMLLNMAAALLTVAAFLLFGLTSERRQGWAAPFLVTGVIALACGLQMVWTWPLPGPYNVVFGEMTVLLAGLLLGAGICLAAGWDLLPLALLAFVAGGAAVYTGVQVLAFQLTGKPLVTAIGFILTGAAGVFAALPLAFPRKLVFRFVGAAVVTAAALVWAATAYQSIPLHVKNFQEYRPLTMKAPAEKPPSR